MQALSFRARLNFLVVFLKKPLYAFSFDVFDVLCECLSDFMSPFNAKLISGEEL